MCVYCILPVLKYIYVIIVNVYSSRFSKTAIHDMEEECLLLPGATERTRDHGSYGSNGQGIGKITFWDLKH